MPGTFSFLPGQIPAHPGPLARFLPPTPEGSAATWLVENIPPGSWIIDPFGASPRLAVEAARAGYRVLVAANNPIERFLIELTANPPVENELRAALADLAATQKSGERIEPHLRALYRTECAQCGQMAEAEAFIWERSAAAPSVKIYRCPACGDSGEHPVTSADVEHSNQFSSTGLHRMRALERVTPLDDPDRSLAEEALDTYLPRTIYALITIINKLESLSALRKRAITALLLPVLDQTNSLWSYPASRARPRQLSTPPRFREQNVWRALESALGQWSTSMQGLPPAALTIWPDQPPASGGICLFEGPLRELAEQLDQPANEPCEIAAALGAIPRPNQAYWTLSALWAGWLWGHQAAAHFKSVLRRRRYDWAWHSTALNAALKNLAQIIQPGTAFLGLIGETEPGYLTASIVAAQLSGFELKGLALRSEQDQAQILWERAVGEPPIVTEAQSRSTALQAIVRNLQLRGEPADFQQLHAAALEGMAQSHAFVTSPLDSPADVLGRVQELIPAALANRQVITHLGGSKSSPETGLWWLTSPSQTEQKAEAEATVSLADQVEIAFVRYLQNHPGCTYEEIDRAMCIDFPGLLTPEQALVQECLVSYGEKQLDGIHWQSRPQDDPRERRSDLQSIMTLIKDLGSRLGFFVTEQEIAASPGQPLRRLIYWAPVEGKPSYIFIVVASTVIGNLVFPSKDNPFYLSDPVKLQAVRRVIVMPGGRANLIAYKLEHNPILKQAIEADWQLVKFRHIRRLSEDANLNRSNLDSRLVLDPLAYTDQQLPLL